MTDRKKRFLIWAGAAIYMIASWTFFVARSQSVSGSEELLKITLFVTFCPPVIAYTAWPLKSKNIALRVLLRAGIFLIQLPLTMAIAFLVGKVLIQGNTVN
jgi:hypothetical protein